MNKEIVVLDNKLHSHRGDGYKRCQVICAATQLQCKRKIMFGLDVCDLHRAYKSGQTTRLSPYADGKIEKDVKQRVYDIIAPIREEKDIAKKLKNISKRVSRWEGDKKLHDLDKDIAYLLDMRSRIENITDLPEAAIIELLHKNIDTLMKSYERRQKIILAQNYTIELEELKIFMKKLVDVINNRIIDSEVRGLLKGDIMAIYKDSLPHRRSAKYA